jgi:predicted nucleic acid-binding Zn ribbon protein
MQQMSTCPGCGSPVKPDQLFCGICGTKLDQNVQQETALKCPGCGSPVMTEQMFCGICGVRITDTVASPEPPPVNPPVTPPPVQSAPANSNYLPPSNNKPEATVLPKQKDRVTRSRKRSQGNGLLVFGGILFMVLGWMILILGSLISIAYIVLGSIGGGFQLLFFGTGDIIGITAIIVGAVGLIISLLIGIQFLIISKLCYSFIDLMNKVNQQ